MSLDIPSEYESVLDQLVASGAYPSTQSALKHALELLAAQQEATATHDASQSNHVMPQHIDIEELARQQTAAVFDASKLVSSDVWPSDEPVDEFIAFLNDARKDVSNPGASR